MDYLRRACRLLGENAADVMSYHVYADRVDLVIDHGIKGGPKYSVLLTDLPAALPEPDALLPEPEALLPEADATDSARDLAGERGLDLREIKGTGHDGRILVRDVRDAMGGE